MLDIVPNFFTGPTEDEQVEPWRCSACNKLIHNIVWEDGITYPAPGAPAAVYESEKYPRICRMCKGMLDAIRESTAANYFNQVDSDNQTSIQRLRRNE